MPQLLLELFSEEIPARMQGRPPARDLERLRSSAANSTETAASTTTKGRTKRGFATPRRLVRSSSKACPAEQSRPCPANKNAKAREIDAPDQAIQGFLRGSTGLQTPRTAERVQKDPKGDPFYLADNGTQRTTDARSRPRRTDPRDHQDVPVAEVAALGCGRTHAGYVRYIRSCAPSTARSCRSKSARGEGQHKPRRAATASSATTNSKSAASTTTSKNSNARQCHSQPRRTQGGDPARGAKQLAHAQNLALIEDDALVDEVAGLVEWPVAPHRPIRATPPSSTCRKKS